MICGYFRLRWCNRFIHSMFLLADLALETATGHATGVVLLLHKHMS